MNRNRIPALAVLLLISVYSLTAQNSALDDGARLIREGHFDQALVKLEEAHRAAPRNATIENLLGITETNLGHPAAASTHYRNAIRIDPSQAAPHRNLGFSLLNEKDYTGAEPELRKASALDPSDPFAHYYLLLLALATNHDSEALKQVHEAGQLVDRDPEAGAGLIEAEIRAGRVDDAANRIKKMEETDQLQPAREYRIAVLLSQRAQFEQASHCFQRIATIDPSWNNRYNLGLALLYDGNSTEASTLLAALHKERPGDANTLTFLGAAFEAQQKMSEALDAYRAAAIADPSNLDRTLDYTRLLMDMDRYDEAIQFIQIGMDQTLATSPLNLRLGAVEMIKGDYSAARDAFNAALAENPELDAAYVGLAQTYAREANDTEAIRVLEAARIKRPGHYLLEYYFGLLASRLGREQEAIGALQQAEQLDPNSPDPSFELGKLYEAKEDWQKARQAFEHVVQLNPQFGAAHFQLSRVYTHLGLRDEAQQEAQRTQELVSKKRNDALRKQRERGGSFQPQDTATSSPNP
ncbi:tetratricopeptide repeat protein [Telmatobacter sp. DSM 110680]|uniref:Tetratricopeptide repeat protein n=1 Tax=Telmatobacter sp. DSM 110680 TaxID=3036704 RepID=A0AAU7DMC9_9BACT